MSSLIELFPGVPFEYCNSQGYWLFVRFMGCECHIHQDRQSARFVDSNGHATDHDGQLSLSWLRSQCCAVLRAGAESAGYVMLTQGELDTLTRGPTEPRELPSALDLLDAWTEADILWRSGHHSMMLGPDKMRRYTLTYRDGDRTAQANGYGPTLKAAILDALGKAPK